MKEKKLWSLDFILACIANLLMGVSFYLLVPTLPFYLASTFNSSKSVIGLVASCYVIAALLIRPFSGYLVDSFSRKWIYILSFVAFGLLNFGYLVASSVVFLFVLRFMHGLTWGVITTSGNTLAIDIMPAEKRGRGIGFYGMSLNIAMAIGPMLGIFLYQHYPFVSIFWLAIITGFAGLVCAIFIKVPRHEPVHHHKLLSLDRFLMVKGLPIGLNVILITLSYGMILSFSAMYSAEVGATNPGLFFTLLAVGLGAARAMSGKMIDGGRLNSASMIGIAILSVSFVMFSLFKVPAMYYLSALCIGLGYGVVYPALQTIFVNMATHQQRGTANSTFLTAFDAGVGLGMLLAGKIAEVSSLSTAFMVSAASCLIGLLYYVLISKQSYNRHKIVNG